MKKFILVMAAIILAATFVNAQTGATSTTPPSNKKATVSIAANVGAPLTSGYKIAFGGDLQIDIPFSQSLFGTISGGYENYSYKTVHQGTVTFPEGNTNFIPVLAGIKYYFSDKFYGHGQAGYAFSTTKGGGGSFTFAPSIGYNLSRNFDASLKYTEYGKTNSSKAYGGTSLGTIALRLAYDF
jgi:hypothetical protein